VRSVTLQEGYDPRRFALVAFGGAGPLHAAELAEGLGIRTVLVPPHPGIMAALGLTVPHLRRDFRRTVLLPLGHDTESRLEASLQSLEVHALQALRERIDVTVLGAIRRIGYVRRPQRRRADRRLRLRRCEQSLRHRRQRRHQRQLPQRLRHGIQGDTAGHSGRLVGRGIAVELHRPGRWPRTGPVDLGCRGDGPLRRDLGGRRRRRRHGVQADAIESGLPRAVA